MTKARFVRFFLLLLAWGFLSTILWPFWVDSLCPLIRQGNYVAAVAETGGFLLVLAALGPMVYSVAGLASRPALDGFRVGVLIVASLLIRLAEGYLSK